MAVGLHPQVWRSAHLQFEPFLLGNLPVEIERILHQCRDVHGLQRKSQGPGFGLGDVHEGIQHRQQPILQEVGPLAGYHGSSLSSRLGERGEIIPQIARERKLARVPKKALHPLNTSTLWPPNSQISKSPNTLAELL
jgi:hypothetical protein